VTARSRRRILDDTHADARTVATCYRCASQAHVCRKTPRYTTPVIDYVIGLDVAIRNALVEPFHQVSLNRLPIPYSQASFTGPRIQLMLFPVLSQTVTRVHKTRLRGIGSRMLLHAQRIVQSTAHTQPSFSLGTVV
jgi:hypothetical protein